uniref:Uncharacterized protein n=1 Tax=Trypanosoma brucei TaxID=5691 RepID=Q581I5_9TRYP|nr:hypothetical protein, unlikely [Trypanosoma brucei]AAX80128.1 hypothetical protein, unlikely [Trypanosoma brucei]
MCVHNLGNSGLTQTGWQVMIEWEDYRIPATLQWNKLDSIPCINNSNSLNFCETQMGSEGTCIR